MFEKNYLWSSSVIAKQNPWNKCIFKSKKKKTISPVKTLVYVNINLKWHHNFFCYLQQNSVDFFKHSVDIFLMKKSIIEFLNVCLIFFYTLSDGFSWFSCIILLDAKESMAD